MLFFGRTEKVVIFLLFQIQFGIGRVHHHESLELGINRNGILIHSNFCAIDVDIDGILDHMVVSFLMDFQADTFCSAWKKNHLNSPPF